MQPGVKTATLWSKSKTELEKQLEELKLELVNLRVQKISSGATSKLTKMYVWFCKAVSVYGFSECLGVGLVEYYVETRREAESGTLDVARYIQRS